MTQSNVYWYPFSTDKGRELVWIMTNKQMAPGVKISAGEALGHIEFSFFEETWFLFVHHLDKTISPLGRVSGLKAAKLMLYLYCFA